MAQFLFLNPITHYYKDKIKVIQADFFYDSAPKRHGDFHILNVNKL